MLLRVGCLLAVLCGIGLTSLFADDPVKPPKTPTKDKDTVVKPGKVVLTPEHEAAARAFVIVNHPDLDDVLSRLKQMNRAEYEKALRQLYQNADRLTRLKEDDPERHEVELRAWRIDSRLRLLIARLSVGDSPAAQDELKQVVVDELEAKTDMLKLEQKRYTARLKKLEADLARLQQAGSKDEEVKTRLADLKKEIGRTKPRMKQAAKTPAAP